MKQLLALGAAAALGAAWITPPAPANPGNTLSSTPVAVQRAAQLGAAGCPQPTPGINYSAPGVSGGGKTVALTFDDGPGPSTAAILSILESEGVRASFFNIGLQEAAWPQEVSAEEEAGFLVGNHTWDHPDMTTLSAAAQAAEMDKVIAEQQSIVGTVPCIFRPPYGDYDSTTLALAAARHMSVWLWDVDPQDWEADGSSSSYWVNRIVQIAESEGGALSHPVVILHNQAIPMPATVAALPIIINWFKAHGYTFVDLLGRSGAPAGCGSAPPPSPAFTSLGAGQHLLPHTSLASPHGQYVLVMQRDGNLVFSTASNRPLWATGTSGTGAWAEMQADGNFVVYSKTGTPLWSSGTAGHPWATLAIQADARLVIHDGGHAIWASKSADYELTPGEALRTDWYIQSPGTSCRLDMQPSGDLVLSAADGQTLWQSGTTGAPGAYAILQGDGNLVVYSPAGKVVWASGTKGSGVRLVTSRDGTIFGETLNGVIIWFRP